MYCPRCGTAQRDQETTCGTCSTSLPTAAFAGGAAVPEVPNYLFSSVVATLCCCPVAGPVALYQSVQALSRRERGDYLGAARTAGSSLLWIRVSLGFWLVAALLLLVANLLNL